MRYEETGRRKKDVSVGESDSRATKHATERAKDLLSSQVKQRRHGNSSLVPLGLFLSISSSSSFIFPCRLKRCLCLFFPWDDASLLSPSFSLCDSYFFLSVELGREQGSVLGRRKESQQQQEQHGAHGHYTSRDSSSMFACSSAPRSKKKLFFFLI